MYCSAIASHLLHEYVAAERLIVLESSPARLMSHRSVHIKTYKMTARCVAVAKSVRLGSMSKRFTRFVKPLQLTLHVQDVHSRKKMFFEVSLSSWPHHETAAYYTFAIMPSLPRAVKNREHAAWSHSVEKIGYATERPTDDTFTVQMKCRQRVSSHKAPLKYIKP